MSFMSNAQKLLGYGPAMVENLSPAIMRRVRQFAKQEPDGSYCLSCVGIGDDTLYVQLSRNESPSVLLSLKHLGVVNTSVYPNGSHRIMTTIRVTDAGEVVEINRQAVVKKARVISSTLSWSEVRGKLLPVIYGEPLAWSIYGQDKKGLFVPEAVKLREADNSSMYRYYGHGRLVASPQGLRFHTEDNNPAVSFELGQETDLEKNYIKYAGRAAAISFYADLTVAGIFVLGVKLPWVHADIPRIEACYVSNPRNPAREESAELITFKASVKCEEIEARNLALLCRSNKRNIWITIKRMSEESRDHRDVHDWDIEFVGNLEQGEHFQNRLKRLFEDRVTCARFVKFDITEETQNDD